jgi:hypothetical protein
MIKVPGNYITIKIWVVFMWELEFIQKKSRQVAGLLTEYEN